MARIEGNGVDNRRQSGGQGVRRMNGGGRSLLEEGNSIGRVFKRLRANCRGIGTGTCMGGSRRRDFQRGEGQGGNVGASGGGSGRNQGRGLGRRRGGGSR